MHFGHESAGPAEVVPRSERVDGFGVLGRRVERPCGALGRHLLDRALESAVVGAPRWRSRAAAPCGALERRRPACSSSRSTRGAAELPRVVRFLGHGPGDELGPVYARGRHEPAATALRAMLGELDWDVFLGEQLPGDEGWSQLVGGRTWRREASPTLHLPRSWEEYVAGRSANFRQQLRRREEALAREGDVAMRLAGEATLDGDLDALFALHRARWGSERTDFHDTPFHRERRARGARAGMATALAPRARRPPDRRLARLPGRLGYELLPGGSRSGIRLALAGLPAHVALDPLGNRGRSDRVPVRPWGRSVQGQVRERGSWARVGCAEPRRGRRGHICSRTGGSIRPSLPPLTRARTGSSQGPDLPQPSDGKPGLSTWIHPIG